MTFNKGEVFSLSGQGAETTELKPVVCLVCGRASNTGHHYGVTACLGCKTFFRRVVLQGSSPKCKFQNKCLLVKGSHAKRICRSCRFMKCKDIGMREQALHPCRDLIGRRQPSQSESISPSDSPSSSSSYGGVPKLSQASEDALYFLYSIREMDSDIRRRTVARRGQYFSEALDVPFYNPSCDFSGVSVNSELCQSIKTDIAMLQQWVTQVPSFNLLSTGLRRHLLRRFCLMFVTLEHGLFTTQMPEHENVWFLSDRTCLIRDFHHLPQEIKRSLTPKITMEQQLLFPFTSLLIDEIAQPLRRLQPRPEEIAALKVLMLMKPTILRETEGIAIASAEELRLIGDVRNKVLAGLHAFYVMCGVDNVEERISEVLMLSGGVAVCAAQGLEGLHLLRFFDMATFDTESERLIFGN